MAQFWSLIVITIALSSMVSVADESFQKETNELSEDIFYVIYFYSSKCNQCRDLMSTWEDLKKHFQNDALAFGQVNCDIKKELCSSENFQDIPLIKLYSTTNGFLAKYDSDTYDKVSLENFIKTKTSIVSADESKNEKTQISGLYELTDEDFDIFLSKGEHFVNFYAPWCKYCKILEPTWSSLAQTNGLNSAVKISKIDCTANVYACSYHNIKEYPSLLWISDGKVTAKYQGSKEMENLKAFVDSQLNYYMLKKAMNEIKDDDEDHIRKWFDSPDQEMKEKLKNLDEMMDIKKSINKMVSAKNFEDIIKSGYTFMEFCVSWSKHCRDLEKEWILFPNLKKVLPVDVLLVRWDCSLAKQVCDEQEVDGYPTLNLYKDGKRLEEYNGERTAVAMLNYLKQKVSLDLKDEL